MDFDNNLCSVPLQPNWLEIQLQAATFRDFKKLDEGSIRENLGTAPLYASEIFDSVDDSYDYWNTLFSTILDEHLPVNISREKCFYKNCTQFLEFCTHFCEILLIS